MSRYTDEKHYWAVSKLSKAGSLEHERQPRQSVSQSVSQSFLLPKCLSFRPAVCMNVNIKITALFARVTLPQEIEMHCYLSWSYLSCCNFLQDFRADARTVHRNRPQRLPTTSLKIPHSGFIKKLDDVQRKASLKQHYLSTYCSWGTRWRIRLRHCATSRKVGSSIPGRTVVLRST